MVKGKLGNILAFAFLVFLICYLVINDQILRPLLEVPVPLLLCIGFLYAVQIVVSGLFTKVVLSVFNTEISHKESSYIALISSIGNYFGPLLGGLGVRAAYLKKKYNFSLSYYVGTIYGYYLITFFSTSIIALMSLGFIYMETGKFSWVVASSMLSIAVLTLLLFFIKLPKWPALERRKFIGGIYKRALQAHQGWEILLQHKGLLKKLLLIAVAAYSVGLITFYLEFRALGLQVPLTSVILYSALGSMSLLISFTPGAIGIRESIYIFSASILALSNTEILQLAAIDRGINILVLLTGFIILQFRKR